MVKRILSTTLLLATLAAPFSTLYAQESKPTTVYNIKGNLPDLRFNLQGVNGNVTEQVIQGKVAVVFFGYASCPDICPTTMVELSALKQEIDKTPQHPHLSDKLQIIFISVDPHRDTPKILQAYVDAFDNGAIGLTGTTEQIADIAKRYRVAYQIGKPKDGAASNDYEVMHAQGVYIFDQQQKAVYLASNAEDTDLIKEKLIPLLEKAK